MCMCMCFVHVHVFCAGTCAPQLWVCACGCCEFAEVVELVAAAAAAANVRACVEVFANVVLPVMLLLTVTISVLYLNLCRVAVMLVPVWIV